MPSRNVVEMLARRRPLTPSQWAEIVEARAEIIRPNMGSYNLPRLGDVECLVSEYRNTRLVHVEKTTGDNRFSIDTRGIFCYYGVEEVPKFEGPPEEPLAAIFKRQPDRAKKIWGLTRSGHWVVATVHFKDTDGYKGRGCEVSTELHIAQPTDAFTLIEMTKLDPRLVLHHLDRAIMAFVEQRRVLYEKARADLEWVSGENRMLCHLLC